MEGILGEAQKADIMAIREGALDKLFGACMNELMEKIRLDPAAKSYTIYSSCKDKETATLMVARFMEKSIKAELVKGWMSMYIVCEIEEANAL